MRVCVDRWTDGRLGGRMRAYVRGWVDGWMDGRMDGFQVGDRKIGMEIEIRICEMPS